MLVTRSSDTPSPSVSRLYTLIVEIELQEDWRQTKICNNETNRSSYVPVLVFGVFCAGHSCCGPTWWALHRPAFCEQNKRRGKYAFIFVTSTFYQDMVRFFLSFLFSRFHHLARSRDVRLTPAVEQAFARTIRPRQPLKKTTPCTEILLGFFLLFVRIEPVQLPAHIIKNRPRFTLSLIMHYAPYGTVLSYNGCRMRSDSQEQATVN